MPRLTLALSAVVVLALLTVFTVVTVSNGHAAAAPSTTVIKPGALPRGADVAIPHLEGRTVVDGDVRIPVERGAVVRLLGKSGASYVVSTTNKHGSSSRILRIAPDGTRTVLAKGEVFEPLLSSDGLRVFAMRYGAESTVVTAWQVSTGQVLATRRFRGFPSILDARNDVALLGVWGRGTLHWTVTTGSVLRLTKRVGGAASLADDLLSTFSTDPYNGGCTIVSRVSNTGDDLWKSCHERVESFAPGGRRMVTVHILSDGIGPSEASVRTVGGRLVGRYRVDGWFGALTFESSRALLLEVNGQRRATTARCDRDACERAAKLAPVQPPRAG